MKKSVLIFGSALMLFACQKEDTNMDNGNPSRLTNNNWESIDYEEYDYPNDYEAVLQGYFDIMEEGTALSNKSIEETVWIMESGMNYLNHHPVWLFDETTKQEVSYTLSLDENNEVDGADITSKFTAFYNFVESNKPVDHQYLVSNVTVEELNGGGDLKLAISTRWALDPTNVSGQTANGPIPATSVMEAGTDVVPCNNNQESPNSVNANRIGGFAFDGYKMMKYGNQNPYPHFASNTYSMGSTFNPNNKKQFLSPDKLFGQGSSVIPQYNTFSPANTCLNKFEINTYSQEIYETLFDIAGTDKRVTNLRIKANENVFDVAWLYNSNTEITEWLQVYADPSFNPTN